MSSTSRLAGLFRSVLMRWLWSWSWWSAEAVRDLKDEVVLLSASWHEAAPGTRPGKGAGAGAGFGKP